MKVLAIICLLFGVTLAMPSQSQLDASLNGHWENFKQEHGKVYKSEFEYVRRIVWEANLKYIQNHNLDYDMGKHTYSLGMNQFGDMTFEEFRSNYLGLKFDVSKRNATGNAVYMSPLNIGDLPDTVDWRTKGYVTPVKNQGQCGSCWSFSATGSLEGQYFRKNGKLVSFSEQQLVDCSTKYGNHGCNGGLMDFAFKYIKDNGIETEQDYPYHASDESCKFSSGKVVTKDTGAVDIPQGDEAKLKEAVGTVGPVAVAIDANHMSFQFYRHGVYNERSCSSTQLDHGVLAAGYGTESGDDYWLVKNSWGAGWGMDGYIKMSRNRDNQCGIASSASYPSM